MKDEHLRRFRGQKKNVDPLLFHLPPKKEKVKENGLEKEVFRGFDGYFSNIMIVQITPALFPAFLA